MNNSPASMDVQQAPRATAPAERISGIAPVPPVVRNYQDLEGGVGREVNFRPPRYQSAEFGPVGAVVNAVVDGKSYTCVLHDVSQNGVAFEWHEVGRLEVGATISVLTVSFDRHEAYRGAARVGSVRDADGYQLVGASFLDTLMNIDDVLQLRDVKAWSGAGPGLALKERPWRFAGHERFKSLVAEMRLLLLDAEQQLGELEASLPWHVVHGGDQDLPARDALIHRLRTEVVDEIMTVYNEIGSMRDPVSPAEHRAMKEYSIRQLNDLLMQASWLRRARDKPLGYPGDFELMNGIYGIGAFGSFAGNTLFAKTLNLFLVNTPAARAVAERKNVVAARLSKLLDECKPSGRPIRVLSLAAGPAQETYELLSTREHFPTPVEIVLFDQDKRALSFAYGRFKQLPAVKYGQVRIVYLHDTIKRLLRDPRLFASFGEFDMIFSCGLFDYLPQATATTLTTNLYANLASGGSLYVGNQTIKTTSRWLIEFLADWYLIYREHSEMLAFASAGVPTADISILEEPTGINPFVVLRRP
ncbi:MAG: hypothetical protein QM778_24885 [Myxococcales bacterium]